MAELMAQLLLASEKGVSVQSQSYPKVLVREEPDADEDEEDDGQEEDDEDKEDDEGYSE